MVDQLFQRLTSAEKENFSRIVNQLLAHTFLLAEEYDFAEGMTRINKDYIFTERNFELFQEYLEMAGFRLDRDSGYGVITLFSSYDGNRVHFDKLTTVITYALRLIYEEEREKLSLSKEVFITTGELVQKLFHLGAISRRPGNTALHDALRSLARFRVIIKKEGQWENAETKILILPSILFIVTNEQISNMARLIEPLNAEEEEEEEPDEMPGDDL